LAGDLPVQLAVLDELGSDWGETQSLTQRLRKLMPRGADAVLDYFPGGPGSAQAASAMAQGATFVHMGGSNSALTFALRDMMIFCWRFVGTRACTRSDAEEVLALLADRRLDAEDLITHRFSLDQINEALEATRTRTLPIWMAVVKP